MSTTLGKAIIYNEEKIQFFFLNKQIHMKVPKIEMKIC
jgi:hypothetical protein